MLLDELLLLHHIELQIAEAELAREAHLTCLGPCEAAQRQQQRAADQDAQWKVFHRR
jgi:hypothetical protein